jgi:outer membrane protein OmpA-like peptidoglycan-associated protein
MRARASVKAPILLAVCLSFLAAGSAWADGMPDCPPVGHLPGYAPYSHKTRDYDQRDFNVQKGDQTTKVTVAGSTCRDDYQRKGGTEEMSSLEIQMNYRQQLASLGAQTTWSNDDHTTAKLVKGNQETWIEVESGGGVTTVIVLNKKPLTLTLTAPSGKDYRLLGHMPTYHAWSAEKRNFDKLSFTVQNGSGTQNVEVMGAKYIVNYSSNSGMPQQSELAIQTNYRSALKKLGAQILYSSDGHTTARLDDKGQPIWIEVETGGGAITVSVIEEKSFAATIQPPKADAMKAALDKDGHLALYVHFDFNKATLRPNAKPIIDQVIALMKNNPDLKLEIDGHTDSIGGHDYNVKLSQDRAAAVVAAVVAGGIDKARLKSTGFGPDKPIADNTKPDGRAKNRRVELVKI